MEIRHADIFGGIEEKELDLITLDLLDAHKAVPIAFDSLKNGGWLVSYVPTVEQMRDFVLACRDMGFENIESFESMLRSMVVKERGTRPQTKGVFHTGYITFARKPKN